MPQERVSRRPRAVRSGIAGAAESGPHADLEEDFQVTAAAFLIRHSSIYGNDDEFEDYMLPLIKKIKSAISCVSTDVSSCAR